MTERGVKAYMLFSSSKGNAAYVQHNDIEILIDAGVSARRIGRALNEIGTDITNIDAIFITHEHEDHTKGLNVISKRHGIAIYAPLMAAKSIAHARPETKDYLVSFDHGQTITLGGMKVSAYRTNHDSAASVGFRIDFGDFSFGYATDLGYLCDSVVDMLTGCETVVIESNHDPELLYNGDYPRLLKARISGKSGHLSNADCAGVLPDLVNTGTKNIVLAHLSENNNRPHIAFGECKGRLTACGFNVRDTKDMDKAEEGEVCLTVAPPDQPLRII